MTEISREKLKDLYETHTNDEVCEILDISKVTLVKYLKMAGIELKGKGGGFAGKTSVKINIID